METMEATKTMAAIHHQTKNTCETDPFAGFAPPPCAKFLNNINPLVNEDGRCIIVNYNRVYCFVTLSCQEGKENPFFPGNNIANFCCHSNFNWQISFSNYLISFFIHQIQIGEIQKEKQMRIHENPVMNDMINSLLDNPPELCFDCIPSLNLHCSNANAVMPLYWVMTNISPLNFYIVILLILWERDANLYLGNNAYVTPDAINQQLASLYFPCPNENDSRCNPFGQEKHPSSCSGSATRPSRRKKCNRKKKKHHHKRP